MSCVYCGHYILYKLNDGNFKCAKCKRKFSPKKLTRKAQILKGFLDELNPNEISKKYNISYASVIKEIKNIRIIMAKICEDEFLKKEDIKEFEEYIYLSGSLKNAQNFLTIDFGGKIYNIMLSSLKNYNFDEKEIKKMLKQSRIIKIYEKKLIKEFWVYFENFMKKFKGINKENFFYYLKEAEFRFNNYKIEVKDLIY